jgi:hypothetical protein
VGDRKALLIGVQGYGEGFASLPAVVEDLRSIGTVLEAAGYELERCPPELLSNATELDGLIRTFCVGGGPEDVRLIYFSGHGIVADGVDCVVPAGVKRKDAAASPNQRVSTDLSKTVADAETGLVLFVIDACRDPVDVAVTKGAAEWGDPKKLARPSEHRFIRYFGCAPSQVCQIVPSSAKQPASSLFTRSLADCIAKGDAVTLETLLLKVKERCAELLAGNPMLQSQEPHLSYGELSGESHGVLKLALFEPIKIRPLSSVWPEFDPDKLHCLVVLSEYEVNRSPDWGLTELVQDAVVGETGDRIWSAFRKATANIELLTGRRRSPPPTFETSSVRVSVLSVLDVFASTHSLDIAVRAIAEADLAVFDVTAFEPGIMLLVGIRSACRRWLTVCSHGADWKEGKPLEIPFNLQDLNINSHTPSESLVGSDPVVERFVRRVETGFEKAAQRPHYLDLPGYDALRQLGSHYEASSTIDPSERILVLCAYADSFSNWQDFSSRLKQVLWQRKKFKPLIERIIDYGTSQLVRQSIYEQIRRTAACVVDWSKLSASVFLELGARLAVSEWGAIQVIDHRYLPGEELALGKSQVERMSRLLQPFPYMYRSESLDAFEQIVDELLKRNPNLDEKPTYNRIHRALLPVIEKTQTAEVPLIEGLKRQADALHHPQQSRVGAPQILFHSSRTLKQSSERAALELRIAAWLYMEYRGPRGKLKADEDMMRSYRDLGQSVLDALYDLGDDESLELAAYIEDRLNQKG